MVFPKAERTVGLMVQHWAVLMDVYSVDRLVGCLVALRVEYLGGLSVAKKAACLVAPLVGLMAV